jgi:hypothetical protein
VPGSTLYAVKSRSHLSEVIGAIDCDMGADALEDLGARLWWRLRTLIDWVLSCWCVCRIFVSQWQWSARHGMWFAGENLRLNQVWSREKRPGSSWTGSPDRASRSGGVEGEIDQKIGYWLWILILVTANSATKTVLASKWWFMVFGDREAV